MMDDNRLGLFLQLTSFQNRESGLAQTQGRQSSGLRLRCHKMGESLRDLRRCLNQAKSTERDAFPIPSPEFESTCQLILALKGKGLARLELECGQLMYEKNRKTGEERSSSTERRGVARTMGRG